MTLALRLQIAFGLLALIATGAVGILTRTAWQNAEQLQSTCDHDGDIDQTAMDLEHGLTAERRLSISQLVKDQMQALGLDELSLFTGTGEILGAGHDPAAAGKVDRALLAQPAAKGTTLLVRPAGARSKAALVARCSHSP